MQRLLSYLLCLFLLVASLDRVPDPPVVQPHPDKAAAFCFTALHQVAADRDHAWFRVLFDPRSHARCFEKSLLAEHKPASLLAAYVIEASDSSPPTV